MFELFDDDITFCASQTCKNRDCMRHFSNIKHPEFPVSFAMFEGTDTCPNKKEHENGGI